MGLNEIWRKLRRHNKSNYRLYMLCSFIAALLITAYTAMMFSPTTLEVLPVGGDSRKQMYMIFALTVTGCIVFTVYAAGLFYRMKAREIGLFLALGISKRRLAPQLLRETLVLGGGAALAGMALGMPFAAGIWQLFRLFLIDSEEMVLRFDYRSLLVACPLLLLIIGLAFLYGRRYVGRLDIMDTLLEEHKNEKLPKLKRWYGYAGIALLLGGAIGGYYAPIFYMKFFQQYSPWWLNLLYLPVLAGLYLILLQTITYGWMRRRGSRYKNIISRSMMKFQGRQTVNTMLVTAVLVAGACFGIFYVPMMIMSSKTETRSREYDYLYQLPDNTASALSRPQINALAGKHQVTISDYCETPYIIVAGDGMAEIEGANRTFKTVYAKRMTEINVVSASAYEQLTGRKLKLPAGQHVVLSNQERTNLEFIDATAKLLTNPDTDRETPTKLSGYQNNNSLSALSHGLFIVNDAVYARLSEGLRPELKGKLVTFQAGQRDNYAFAQALYRRYTKTMGRQNFISSYYERVVTDQRLQATSIPGRSELAKAGINSPEFKQNWRYMPKFRLLDSSDMMKNYAVFLMMFLFIAIVCISAATIICLTRCTTLGINNAYIFEDMQKLGAPPAFLHKELSNQCRSVFITPSCIGAGLMFLLYTMIMQANDGQLVMSEVYGLLGGAVLLLAILLILYLVYRRTLSRLSRRLIAR